MKVKSCNIVTSTKMTKERTEQKREQGGGREGGRRNRSFIITFINVTKGKN